MSRRLLVVALAIFAVIAAALGIARADGTRRERVYLFVDCSGSMASDVSANVTRYDEAITTILRDVSVKLSVGTEIFVVPFDIEPLDPAGGKVFAAPRPEDAPAVVASLREYLMRYRQDPGKDGRMTAIWNSVERYLGHLRQSATLSNVWIYTDGEDNASVGSSRKQVEDALWQGRDAKERRGRGIRIWTWDVNRPPPQARAAIRLLTDEIVMRSSEFAAGPATFQMKVRAAFAADPGVTPEVAGVTVELRPLGSAPPIRVVSAALGAPLSPQRTDGTVDVRCQGTFPPGEHRYQIEMTFPFKRSRDETVAERPDREGVLRVSSQPVVRLSASQGKLELLEGDAADIDFDVSGNEDASGLAAEVRWQTSGGVAGVTWVDDDGDPLPDARIALQVPAYPGKRSVRARIRGLSASDAHAEIVFQAAVTGSQARQSVAVSVLRRVISVGLARPSARTELGEGGTAWFPVASSPVVADVGTLRGKGATMTFSAPADGDVEFGVGDGKAQSATVPADAVAGGGVRLFARWRGGTAKRGFRASPVRVSGVMPDGRRIEVTPASLELQDAFRLPAPDVRFRWLGSGAQPVQVLQGHPVECDLVLDWNAAARGGTLTVTCPSARPDVKVPAAAELGLEFAGGGIKLREKGPTQGRISVTVAASAQPGTSAIDLKFDVAPPSGAPFSRAVRIPVEVRPPCVTATLDADLSAAVGLAPGIVAPLGRLELTANGAAVPVEVVLEGVPGLSLRLADAATSRLDVPADGTTEWYVEIVAAKDAVGSPEAYTAQLVLRPAGPATGQAVVRFGDAAPAPEARLVIPVRIDKIGLAAFYRGKECAKLPPSNADAVPYAESVKGWKTRALPSDFSLTLKHQFSDLPPAVGGAEVRATGTGAVGAVLFVVGTGEPAGSVTADQLAGQDVDLVLTAAPGVGRSMFVSAIVPGSVEVRCEGLGATLVIPVRLGLPARWPMPVLLIALALVGLAMWGVGMLVSRINARQRAAAAAAKAAAVPPKPDVDPFDEIGGGGAGGGGGGGSDPF